MKPFKLEEYFWAHEFSAKYLLCSSDAESLTLKEVLAMASPEELELWENLTLGYTECQGLPKLRKSISEIYGLSMDNILVFSGAEEGIFCALSSLLTKDDHAIVLTPCYQSLAEIPEHVDAELTRVELLASNQWRIDLKNIENAIKPNTKVLIINFPHNPTGQILNNSEMKSLVDLCTKYDLWLFSDEAYYPLGEPEEGFAKPAASLYPKAMSLGVMSKAFSLPGVRIGWIACQNKAALTKIKRIKNYTTICNSAPSEILSLIALNNRQKILDQNNRIIRNNLALLDDFFKRRAKIFSWVRPQAGCVGFVKYNGDVEKFCKDLLGKKNVLLLPGSIYEHSEPYFRIGFGRKNMPEALAQLEDFLTNH